MRVATWNVNNVRKRLTQLLAWLDSTKPDVAALHELKAETAAFPHAELAAAGYSCLVAGQRRWNGFALLSSGYGTINAPDGTSSSRISRDYQGKLPCGATPLETSSEAGDLQRQRNQGPNAPPARVACRDEA